MNLNPIDFNYQDGLNRFPIQDYIDENISVSDNNSSNYTLNVSNIISSNSSNYTNVLRNDVNKLIKEETENIILPLPTTLKHTYIYNSNVAGEIRFWVGTVQSTGSGDPFLPPGATYPPYRTKIDIDGKLKIYYTYDPLINLTWYSGWIDPANQIIALQADSFNQGIALAGLEGQINLNYTTLDNKILGVLMGMLDNDIITSVVYEDIANSLTNIRTSTTSTQLGAFRATLMNTYRGLNPRNALYPNASGIPAVIGNTSRLITRAGESLNALIASTPAIGVAVGIGGSLVGIAYGIYQNSYAIQFLETTIMSQISSNQLLSLQEKENAKIEASIESAKILTEMLYSQHYLNRRQGFINSNETEPQTIPKINTNEITYNGVEISTTLNNYLLKAGGTMIGRINFNYGANVGVPVAGSGGSGERINLNINGITINDYAASIGVSANSLWFSAPNNQNYQWYVNGIERMSLTSNGVLNTSTLQQGGVNVTTISSNIVINQTPNVQKKFMFTGTCSSSMLMPDGITYFAYDIDLRNYTQLKYAPNPNTPYRIFKIKVFFGSVYFGYLTNTKPNVLSYEVYMSNESQAGGGGIGSVGLNVCALGYPENVILNSISPTQLSLVCGDFNFVTVLSRVNGSVFNAIIEDCLF